MLIFGRKNSRDTRSENRRSMPNISSHSPVPSPFYITSNESTLKQTEI